MNLYSPNSNNLINEHSQSQQVQQDDDEELLQKQARQADELYDEGGESEEEELTSDLKQRYDDLFGPPNNTNLQKPPNRANYQGTNLDLLEEERAFAAEGDPDADMDSESSGSFTDE